MNPSKPVSRRRRPAFVAFAAAASLSALSGVLAVPVFAQQEASPAVTESAKGSFIKNRAPVSKEVLRVSLPRPVMATLKNGVRVLVLEDRRSPTVSVTLAVRAGSLYSSNPALADLTASLLDEGTQKRTGQQIAEETQELGVSVGVGSGPEWASLSVSGLSSTQDRMLDLMTDILLRPTFPEDRLRRMKAQRIAGIAQGRTNPTQIVGLVSNKVLYGGTPYERVQPTREQVISIGRPELEAFWKARWVPNGAVLSVAGDVDAKKFIGRLEKALGDWKPGTDAPALPTADVIKAKDAARVFLVDRPGSAQTVLEFGNVGLSRRDPDYFALVVANRILGGGSSARLFQNLREDKGYTYGAYARMSAPANRPGVWSANASVRTEVTGPAAREFVKEFERLQEEPVTADELARAKRAIIGSFALTLESPEAVLARTTELVQDDLPMDYWTTYPARIEAVTAADIQRVARKYLGKNRLQLFAVGERKAIEEELKPLGPISFYDTLGNPVSGDKPAAESATVPAAP